MRNLFALFSSTELATLILAASSYIETARAFNFPRVPSANLDISQLGRVGAVGDFDAISLYQFVGQTQNSPMQNGKSSLLSRYPNGAFATLQGSDGTIQTMCPFVLKDGTLAGVVVGGNFTSVGGVQSSGVALVNAQNGSITALPGLSGKVSALYCDQSSSTVYVGGSFSGANSTNALAWVTGWTNLPFAGFNGPVNSITKAANGNIVFGGDFTGVGNTTSPTQRDLQVIPIGSSTVVGTPSTGTTGFSDPRNIICKIATQDGPGNTWLLADNFPGSWTATFKFGFVPTKVRLYNTKQDGRGTKTWRFTDMSSGGIMNLSYVDNSGEQRFCDARCPLPQNNQTEQDFHFVNTVGMNAFRLDLLEWYGKGAGLSGIELFQDGVYLLCNITRRLTDQLDIYSFAINDFNEPKCDGVSTGALSTPTGPWTVTPSAVGGTSDYLTARLSGTNISPQAASVVFQPNIKQSGNYSIAVYTPGCMGDGTCGTRGRVNITGTFSSGGKVVPVSTEIFQTNNFDKYDQIYFGNVDTPTDTSFKPSITLSPSSGQNGPLTIVAQRVRFDIQTSSGGLNGLFEYNPNQATIDGDFSKSTIDHAGMGLNSGASINAMAVDGKTLYVAGNFSSTNYGSTFSITDSANDIGEGGLNGAVNAMSLNSSVLYFGGSFTGTRSGNTKGLQGVASYNTSTSKWIPMGAGINGVANYIVPFAVNLTAANKPELAIAVSGFFDQVLEFSGNKAFNVSNFAVWIPSKANWLNNLNIPSVALHGILTAVTVVPKNLPLFAGSVSSQELSASGAVEITGTGTSLEQFPVAVQKSQTSSVPSRKRSITSGDVNGVVTGAFYNQNGLNVTVYGGHFQATATNGSIVNNLAIINGSSNDLVTGLTAGVNTNSVFQAIGIQGTLLFAGGRVGGNVNGKDINGMVVYDIRAANYAPNQPPSLQGTSVAVNAIAPQPSTTSVFVGGNFNSAGSFSCPSLCMYDTSRAQWNSPGNGLGGTVAAMAWVDSTHLILVGNLTLNNNGSNVISYDSKKQSFLPIGSREGSSGTLTSLTSGSPDGSKFWVAGKNSDGSALLEKYDGAKWQTASPNLGPGSVIEGLQVFTTTQKHGTSDTLDQANVLLVLGQLNLGSAGNASAALYNGTAWTPYLLATSGTNDGSLSQIFVQNPSNFFMSGSKFSYL
jgi:hypothetical protein